MGDHQRITPEELRRQAIDRDAEGWWLREFAVSEWAKNTVYPASIERWVRQIGDRKEWKAKS